jgi:hypothetical protein
MEEVKKMPGIMGQGKRDVRALILLLLLSCIIGVCVYGLCLSDTASHHTPVLTTPYLITPHIQYDIVSQPLTTHTTN